MPGEMNGKTCAVTGANSGIGFYTAMGLAAKGAEVIMVCRDPVRGQAALEAIHAETGNNNLSMILADLSSLKTVSAAAAEFKSRHDRLHVLVNNAGAIFGKRMTTADGYEMTFQVNHLAPFLFTNLLLPVIERSAPARIVNVSSMGHFIGKIHFNDLMLQKNYDEMKAYAQSKLANILFTKQLTKVLEGRGVTANCLHPGVVNTNFARSGSMLSGFFYKTFGSFMDTPEKGARTSIYLASSPEVEGRSGGYYSGCKETTPSKDALNPDHAQKLWDMSAKLAGLENK